MCKTAAAALAILKTGAILVTDILLSVQGLYRPGSEKGKVQQANVR